MLKSYIGPMVMTFFIALFILLMQFLWKYIDDFVGKGLEWYIIAKLMFYASATFVPLALPLAILLSSLMMFGNLGERYELVAIKAAGISLSKAMRPLVILSIIISGIAFYFSNNVMPYANLKFKTLLFDVQSKKPAVNIKEGIYYGGIDGYIIRVGKKDKDGKGLHDVMIYDHTRRSGNSSLILAKRGSMVTTSDNRYLIFHLYDGISYDEMLDDRSSYLKRPMMRAHFKEQYVRFDLSAFAFNKTNEELFKSHYQMLNLMQLERAVDTLSKSYKVQEQIFSTNMIGRYFFLNTFYTDTVPFILPDSVNALNPKLLANIDPIKRTSILDNALQAARAARADIDYNRMDFKYRKEEIQRHKIEWHRKFTLSIACLILFFVGAPLGSIIRKGGLGMPAVLSVILFILFHILSMIGEKSVREGALEAYKGMWIASLVFLPVGIILTFKATTDSPIFDIDVWKRFFRKFIGKN